MGEPEGPESEMQESEMQEVVPMGEQTPEQGLTSRETQGRQGSQRELPSC